jgi:hypothetical protein
MELHAILTEENPNPVLILTRFGKIFYANIPAMNLLNLANLNIGDKIPKPTWYLALSSFIDGIFTFSIGETNYKWKAVMLKNRFIYLSVQTIIEPNLLFTRF